MKMKDDQQCISLRALIVEDEILVAEELRHRLLALGFAVIAVVDTADEAVSIVARDRPDLVLMDIRLNGKKDGIRRHTTFTTILMCRLFSLPPTRIGSMWNERRRPSMTASS